MYLGQTHSYTPADLGIAYSAADDQDAHMEAAAAAFQEESAQEPTGLEMVRHANTLLTGIHIKTLEQVTCTRQYDQFMANQTVINRAINELRDLLWAINRRVFEDGFKAGAQAAKESLPF